MIRIANICCTKCKRSIAEIRVEVEQEEKQDWFVPQIDEMKQSFGIPPFFCEKCIKEEETYNETL